MDGSHFFLEHYFLFLLKLIALFFLVHNSYLSIIIITIIIIAIVVVIFCASVSIMTTSMSVSVSVSVSELVALS